MGRSIASMTKPSRLTGRASLRRDCSASAKIGIAVLPTGLDGVSYHITSDLEEGTMALYKDVGYLTQNQGSEFDTIHGPGDDSPHSGIYRCEGCKREIASNAG